MDTLATIVKNDISSFLEGNKELLFNERDFQMHLATYLRNTKKYDDVDTYFPDLSLLDEWQVVEYGDMKQFGNISYQFITYDRIS